MTYLFFNILWTLCYYTTSVIFPKQNIFLAALLFSCGWYFLDIISWRLIIISPSIFSHVLIVPFTNSLLFKFLLTIVIIIRFEIFLFRTNTEAIFSSFFVKLITSNGSGSCKMILLSSSRIIPPLHTIYATTYSPIKQQLYFPSIYIFLIRSTTSSIICISNKLLVRIVGLK